MRLSAIIAACAAALFAATTAAQQYPTKSIRLLVPFGPGGCPGSRRGGCTWGGDGATPPGLWQCMLRSIAIAMTAGAFAGAMPVIAQTYPSKSIRLLVPFGPGGVGDITSRAVGQKIGEALGQQVIIDNRPSAGGIVAMELVAKSEPDGYTLMLHNNTNAVAAAMFKKLPYDTINDYAMISTLGSFSIAVVVAPDSPVKSLAELIAQAKASPGKLNIGTINVGTSQFLSAELFKSMAGVDMATIPYNNTGAVLTSLRGNSVQVAFEFLPPVVGAIKSGALRALAVSSRARLAVLPDVPTAREAGVPGYEVVGWNGIAAPAKTPKAVIDRLNREIVAAVGSPQIRARFQELGVEPFTSTPDGMRKFVVSEIAKWNAVIDKAKIQRQ